MTYCCDCRNKLSIIARLNLSATNPRVGICFAVHQKNVAAEGVEPYLRQVQPSRACRLIVIIDCCAAHNTATRNLFNNEPFWIEPLLPHATDLNLAGRAWRLTKYGNLASHILDALLGLNIQWESAIDSTGTRQELLRAYSYTNVSALCDAT